MQKNVSFTTHTSSIKNETLFQKIKTLVSQENRIGVEILECLWEIDCRRAYSELKYDGLFSFCVKELGFSEAQAYQRIQAMRALKEVPEIKSMIQAGTLSVTAISKIQNHFKKIYKKSDQNPKALKMILVPRGEKLDFFKSFENQSAKAVEKKLCALRGETETKKLVLEMDAELEVLWEKVKNLSAHQTHSDPSKTLKLLAKAWLAKKDLMSLKSEKLPRDVLPLNAGLRRGDSGSIKNHDAKKSRAIPLTLKKEIWRRDEGKCQICETRYSLEIDHIQPYANGGETHLRNLRLLCRSCNQAKAIRDYGDHVGFFTQGVPRRTE